MHKLDKATRFVFRYGSRIMLVAMAMYGGIEYIDINQTFDYILVTVFVASIAEKAFRDEYTV